MRKYLSDMTAEFDVDYSGVVVSLNDYKTLHWRKLKPLYDGVKLEFLSLIRKEKPVPMAWIELRVYHNTKYDLDNLVGIVKPFVDVLRREKVIRDDNRRYWDYLSVQYTPQLEKNTIKFIITGEVAGKQTGA